MDVDEHEGLYYGNTLSPDYTVENLMKTITVKNPTLKEVMKMRTKFLLIKLLVRMNTRNCLRNYLLS
jgi:hypothetical protein